MRLHHVSSRTKIASRSSSSVVKYIEMITFAHTVVKSVGTLDLTVTS
jgi:hypothetical protein